MSRERFGISPTTVGAATLVVAIITAAGILGLYTGAASQTKIVTDTQTITTFTTVPAQTFTQTSVTTLPAQVTAVTLTATATESRTSYSTVYSTVTQTQTVLSVIAANAGISVEVEAPSLASPGQTLQIGALVFSNNDGSFVAANFETAQYHTPDGTLVAMGAPTTVHTGYYIWTIQLPTNATNGVYFVQIWVNNGGIQGQGFGQFTVKS